MNAKIYWKSAGVKGYLCTDCGAEMTKDEYEKKTHVHRITQDPLRVNRHGDHTASCLCCHWLTVDFGYSCPGCNDASAGDGFDCERGVFQETDWTGVVHDKGEHCLFFKEK